MQKLLSFFSLLVILQSLIAQKKFEGKIVYEMMVDKKKEKKPETTMVEAYFGKQKIKVLLNEASASNSYKEDLLLNLEEDVIYRINNKQKTYSKQLFQKRRLTGDGSMPFMIASPERNRKYIGYNTTAFVMADTTKNNFFGPVDFTFWYADSIYFFIKEEYTDFDILPILSNGKSVGMGMKMKMGTGEDEISGEVKPISISAETIPDSIFAIPAGYSLEEQPTADSAMAMVDSSAKWSVDTVAARMPIKRYKGKKTTKPNTKKQPQKNNALNPKE